MPRCIISSSCSPPPPPLPPVERATKDKANQQPRPVGIHPSNVVITKLKDSKDRSALLERKKAGRVAKGVKTSSMAVVD